MKVTTGNDDDNPAVVTVSDQPDNDPINFEVKKVDKETEKSFKVMQIYLVLNLQSNITTNIIIVNLNFQVLRLELGF